MGLTKKTVLEPNNSSNLSIFERQDILWFYGIENYSTEFGTMNIFMFYVNEIVEIFLAIPPINGLILPEVTRQSIIELVLH